MSHTSHRCSAVGSRISVFAAALALAVPLATSTVHTPLTAATPVAPAGSVEGLRGRGFWPAVECGACLGTLLGGTIFFPPFPYLFASDGDVFTACLSSCGDFKL
jgi:hypothetical protein